MRTRTQETGDREIDRSYISMGEVVQVFSSSTWEADLCEFKASLVYTVSSRKRKGEKGRKKRNRKWWKKYLNELECGSSRSTVLY